MGVAVAGDGVRGRPCGLGHLRSDDHVLRHVLLRAVVVHPESAGVLRGVLPKPLGERVVADLEVGDLCKEGYGYK